MLSNAEMPTIVPVICVPIAGESVLSFLTRTAEANWYERVRWLLNKRRIPRWDVGVWPDDIRQAVGALVGLGLTRFDTLCYRPHKIAGRLLDQRHFIDSRAPAIMIETNRKKFCSACLREGRIHPAVFDLKAVTTCPIHKVRLEAKCPTCGRDTAWGGGSLHKCGRCEGDLRYAVPVYTQNDELRCSMVIARRASFSFSESTDLEWPEDASHLDIGQSIELLSILARITAASSDRRQLLKGFFVPRDDVWRGYNALENWPNNFFRTLDAIAAGPEAKRQNHRSKLFGFARVFGEFYERMATEVHEPWSFIKHTFARYAGLQDNIPIVGRADGAVYNKTDIALRPLITPKEAEDILGRKYYYMKALVAAGVLSLVRVGGQRDRVFVKRSEIEALSEGGPPLEKKAAAAVLGVPTIKLDQLLKGGVIPSLIGPTVDGTKHYLFVRRQLQSQIDEIRHRLKSDSDYRPNIKFLTVLRGQETLHLSQGSIFTGIRDGRLPVRGWNEVEIGLAAAYFNNREVDRFLHATHDSERGDVDGLTTLRVSHILICNPMTVVWFTQKGILKHSPSSTPKLRRITRISVNNFLQNFIGASQIARYFKTNAMIVREVLSGAGVYPICEIDSEHGVIVYNKYDIEKLDMRTLIRPISRSPAI